MKEEQAQARLEAARLRAKAAWQRNYAQAYYRQASQPIYAGQELICINKGQMMERLAALNEAEADLVEAKALATEYPCVRGADV